MRFTKTQTAYALLIVCASARLLLQMAALPPYAGLDEVYHVARLAFVRAEHRNPSTTEPSIPPYLMRSIANGRNAGVLAGWPAGVPRLRPVDAAMPAMGEAGEQWPAIVSRQPIIIDRALTNTDLKPYVVKNYEAQQTSIYYSLAAPIVPIRSALFELRVWRAMSLLFALITVLVTAEIGRRWLGPIGILGGAVLVSLPTWETLVMRAGNDAFACMLAAIAVLISVCAPKRVPGIAAEAIVWGLALNAKMYTWPLLVILPLLWWRQRASKSRVIAGAIVAAIAVVLTFAELSSRTRNPLGVVAFDRPGGVVYDAKVNVSEIVRVTIASFAWTSGQHNDALRPIAIALYLIPIFTAILVVRRRDPSEELRDCEEISGDEDDLSSRAAAAGSREATERRRTAKELKMRNPSRSPRNARAVPAAARAVSQRFQRSSRNLRSFAVLRRSIASRLPARRLRMTVLSASAISSQPLRAGSAGGAGVTPAFLALGAFTLAQTYNVVACVLARRGGNDVPIGGKEGWYWYVLAPVIIPALLVPALKRWRAAAYWIVIWDVIITEGALFHDFAGMTSPAHGSILFRWGPLHAPFTASLDGIGVGPLAAWTTAIRVVHLAAFFGLESFLQHMRLNDRNIDVAVSD